VTRRIREALLTLGAVLGAGCLLLGVLAVTAGVHVVVFRSGSMSPTIATGDVALTRTVDASELHPDDVVSVVDSGGRRVTHRVIGVAGHGDRRRLTLRGDANEQPDRETYAVSEAQRVVLVVPKVGYLVAWSSGPLGLLLLGGYGAFLLSVLFRRQGDEDDGEDDGDDVPPPSPRAPAPRPTQHGAPALLAVALGGGLAVVPTHAWAAPWTDPVTIGGSVLTAGTIPAPGDFRCGGLGLLSVTFAWDAVPGATSYTLHYGSGGASTRTGITTTSTSVTSAISGGTAWVVAERGFGSTTWSSVASGSKNYTVAVVSLCG
jgi:signal peptidase I